MNQISRCLSAGMLLSPVLLAVTPSRAQQVVQVTEPQQSILSLAAAPKPEGEILARHPGDATFQHAPANYHVFAAATVGKDAGVETLTINLAGDTRLTRIESKNKDFVIEPGGTCVEGNAYTHGQSCTLQVRFSPQGPGHRLGFIQVSHTAAAKPMSFGLTGNGYAPVVSFTPSRITTVPSSVSAGTGTISGATNLAIDGGDILYIADTGNNKLKEMDSTGVINATALGPISTPASLAADSFGIVYTANTHNATYYFSIYYPWGTQTAYGYAYTSSTCTVGAPCAFSAVGMNYPANMSIDNYDNLFFEEGTQGAAEMPVSNISGGSGSLNLWHLSDQFSYSSGSPGSFASDAYGNIYTKYSFSSTTCYLLEEPLYNAEYSPTATRVAGGTACGFSGDGGQGRSAEISSSIGQIAFDIAGNLYFADSGNQRVRRIDASTGIISTIAGNGTAGFNCDGCAATTASLSNPTGVAVDSQGQVYILTNAPTAGPTQALRKVGAVGRYNFGSVVKGTSSVFVFTVANTGNSSLTLSSNAFFTGTGAADFSVDPNTTSCVLTANAVLAAGRSCKLGIAFTPSAAVARSATLQLMDNTVTGSNTIAVSGTGILATPTIKITSPTSGGSATDGTQETFSVTVTSTSAPAPTGTVTFKVNGSALGSPVTLSGGTASTKFTESTANTYTLSAVYSGDSSYATATASESFTFHTILKPVNVSLVPAIGTTSTCSGPSFSVQVTAAEGNVPTGTVALQIGSTEVSSTSLHNGSAALSPPALNPGPHTFTATYSGDATYQPGASAPLTVVVPTQSSICGTGHAPLAGGTK